MPPTLRVRRLAKRLFEENQKGRSWRVIAKEDYPARREDGTAIIKAGTLSRIAKEGGAWIPKKDEILIELGLRKPKPPITIKEPIPKWLRRIKLRIRKMAKATKESISVIK